MHGRATLYLSTIAWALQILKKDQRSPVAQLMKANCKKLAPRRLSDYPG